METYKLLFKNRSLNEWEILDNNTNQKKTIDICDPHEHKLFSNDVFTYNNDIVNILHSSIRLSIDIPGVLILKSNKTYGRKKKNYCINVFQMILEFPHS